MSSVYLILSKGALKIASNKLSKLVSMTNLDVATKIGGMGWGCTDEAQGGLCLWAITSHRSSDTICPF